MRGKAIMVNTLIKGGYVYDPKNQLEGEYDVHIVNGVIKEVSKNISACNEDEVVNASGMLVCPGLIDLHVHCYEYVTPLGINADKTCLMKGVTTVADAGSAGASTFLGLKKFVMDTSQTRIKAFLHIANHGLASAGCTGVDAGGECDSLNQVNVNQAIKCIDTYPEDIIGIKVRLAEAVCDDGRTEQEVYRRALAARKATNKPLMVHHAFSSIPIEKGNDSCLTCPGSMHNGDIYTHTYHSIIVKDGKVHPEYIEARERGVLFDLGHGAGSFAWNIAEVCAKNEFWPDTISTDLHTSCCSTGPAYDLPTVLSKLLYLGMPLSEIIRSVTFTPAKVMKLEDNIGSLSEGTVADVTLLRITGDEFQLEDCHKETRCLKKRIKAVMVWLSGVRYDCN